MMSLLLCAASEPPSEPQALSLDHLRRLMLLEFAATELPTPAGPLYHTLLALPQRTLPLFWRFSPFRGSSVKVFIRPGLGEGAGGELRVETQRGFVDLLRVINNCNREKGRSVNYLITEGNCVELCTLYRAEHLGDPKLVRRLIKATLAQLPEALARLLAALQPYLAPHALLTQEENVSKTASLFLQKSYRLLLLSRLNQIRQQDERSCREEPSARLLAVEEIERRLEYARGEAQKKLREAFKVLLGQEGLLEEGEGSDFIPYSQWLSRARSEGKRKEKEGRNIFGIKILEESSGGEKERAGSHCRLTLSRCRVLMMLSLNVEVNRGLEAMRGQLGRVERELEVMKKVVKSAEKLEAANSFENELDFMLYIKEKSCRYIATYYWEYEKNREEMRAILMDHYPHNLRELLAAQGKYLSLREKLLLVQAVAAALHWLACNFACHRDLKPDNIMVSEQRVPKLIDFGSCCPVYGVGAQYFGVREARLLGTPHYHRAYDESVALAYRRAEYEQHPLFDVFSFGRVMRDVFEEGLPHLLPNLEALTRYIIERCEEADPLDRLTFQQILFLIENFLRYVDWLESE